MMPMPMPMETLILEFKSTSPQPCDRSTFTYTLSTFASLIEGLIRTHLVYLNGEDKHQFRLRKVGQNQVQALEDFNKFYSYRLGS
jgi:hypothetical protein